MLEFKVIKGLPSTMTGLDRALRGGNWDRPGFPTSCDRCKWASALPSFLRASLDRRFVVEIQHEPKGTIAANVTGLSKGIELADAARLIGEVTTMMSFSGLTALRNPFSLRVAGGVLGIDGEHLLLRATLDDIGCIGAINVLLCANYRAASPFSITVANFNEGKIGSRLSSAIADLTSGIGGSPSYVLYGMKDGIVHPIIGWTTHFELAQPVIEGFVTRQLVPQPEAVDCQGLDRIVQQGLKPLIIADPFFRENVDLIGMT
jgi:hypothetical protein